jgi:hypothetical protein
MEKELDDIQSAQLVDDRYMVTAVQTEAVQGAQLKESSRLRSLLGVLGAGLVLLFVAVSIGEAIRSLRKERYDDTRRSSSRTRRRVDRVATSNGRDDTRRSSSRTRRRVDRVATSNGRDGGDSDADPSLTPDLR